MLRLHLCLRPPASRQAMPLPAPAPAPALAPADAPLPLFDVFNPNAGHGDAEQAQATIRAACAAAGRAVTLLQVSPMRPVGECFARLAKHALLET